MASSRKSKRPRLLSHTRPTSVTKPASLSSQATRSLIRKHHTLQKQLQTAIAQGDGNSIEDLQTQLEASGGLKKYQEASIQGQSSERGGDSSKVLVEWINEMHQLGQSKLRMLEVGALKVDNACSRSEVFDMTRIDLHSQHPDIETRDFMEMPVPSPKNIAAEGFHVVSLSLVVNYVGDAVERGNMLRRVGDFLKPRQGMHRKDEAMNSVLPALFLVLPAPCVTNSRYLNEDRLEEILVALGYVKVQRKLSKKLIYYLWRFDASKGKTQDTVFRKQEVNPGASRNNFTIVLK
ncbi:MAG: hypothetical protein Q9174_003605 [Haloplaca sp. 1 TL-2023]